MIKTILNNKVKYILLSEKNINLLGKKDFEFDFGLNKLKTENNLELFLSNSRLKEKIGDFISNDRNIFLKNKIFIKRGDLIIFTDIFLFQLFLSNKNNYNKNDIEDNIGFFYDKKIFILNKENIKNFIYLSYSLLGNQGIKFVQKIRNNGDFTFYTNKKIFKKSEKKILNLLKNFSSKEKNIISKNNFLEITEKKSVIKKIINFGMREDNLPNFLDENIFYEKIKTDVKIKNGIGNPVLKIHKFNEKKSLGFGYGGIYGFNDKNNFLNKTNSLESFGYDFYSIKNAKIKSFVEGIERFNSGYFDDDLKNVGKLSEADLKSTKKFIGFDIKYKIKNKNTYLKNIFKIEYKNNSEILIKKDKKYNIPLEIITYPNFGKNLFYHGNSNGVGAGRSYEEAFLSGIFELSERDSLMITWIHKLTPDLIDIKSLPVKIGNKIKEVLKIKKGIFYIYDISYDKNFPNILVHFIDENGKNIFGASAKNDLGGAILKALEEVSISLFFEKRKCRKIKDFNNVIEISDHIDFFNSYDNSKYIKFLNTNNTCISFDNLENKFIKNNGLFGFLEKLEGENFITDLTTEYSKELGIFVVKIFNTELIPICFGYDSKNMIPIEKIRFKNGDKFIKWKKIKYKYSIPDFLHFFD